MAKSKPLGREVPKKFVTKSRVQKNGRPKQPRRGINKLKEAAKTFLKRRTKAIAQQKAKKKLEDPLSAAFSASLEASRTFLQQQAIASITTTREDLVQQVTTLNTHFEKEAQAIAKSGEEVRKPLDQEQLQFISKDGKAAGVQSLGDRMKIFKDIVTEEKKKINDLTKQWTDINQSILELAAEVVGPEGICDLSKHMNGELPDYAIPPDKTFEEEVENKTNQFTSEITKVNDTMILQIETYEEELKDARRKQMASLLTAMAAEI